MRRGEKADKGATRNTSWKTNKNGFQWGMPKNVYAKFTPQGLWGAARQATRDVSQAHALLSKRTLWAERPRKDGSLF